MPLSPVAPVFSPGVSRQPPAPTAATEELRNVFDVPRAKSPKHSLVGPALNRIVVGPEAGNTQVTHLYREPLGGRGTAAATPLIPNPTRYFSDVVRGSSLDGGPDEVRIDITRDGDLHRVSQEAAQGLRVQAWHDELRRDCPAYSRGLRPALQRQTVEIVISKACQAPNSYTIPDRGEPHRLVIGLPRNEVSPAEFADAMSLVTSSEQTRRLDQRAFDGDLKREATTLPPTEVESLQSTGMGDAAAGLYARGAAKIRDNRRRWKEEVAASLEPSMENREAAPQQGGAAAEPTCSEDVERYRALRGRPTRSLSFDEMDSERLAKLQQIPTNTKDERAAAKSTVYAVYGDPTATAPQRRAALEKDIERRDKEDEASTVQQLSNFVWSRFDQTVRGVEGAAARAATRADQAAGGDLVSRDLTRAVIISRFPEASFTKTEK